MASLFSDSLELELGLVPSAEDCGHLCCSDLGRDASIAHDERREHERGELRRRRRAGCAEPEVSSKCTSLIWRSSSAPMNSRQAWMRISIANPLSASFESMQ
jgi:hypothetical protein